MELTKPIAAFLVVVLAAAGVAAAGPATLQSVADEPAEVASTPSNVDASATYDNGTVTVTVTSGGDGVENVTVYADGEKVGTTDANGTVTFETNATEELELELEKGNFEGELEYVIRDGSLVLTEESYEYELMDNDEAEDGDEDERETEDEDEDDSEAEAEGDENETDDDDGDEVETVETEDDDAEDDDETEDGSDDDETETDETEDEETESADDDEQ